MKLGDAQIIADFIVTKLGNHFTKLEIVGSIRREKETVHDIDLVGIRVPENKYQFGDPSLEDSIAALDPDGFNGPKDAKRFLDGRKIKRFMHSGISIDLYLADEKTYECIRLIRTGSEEHNKKLALMAKNKNLKLYADGSGLCEIKGGLYNNEPAEIIRVVESTEDGILQNILGRVPEPQKREC